MKRRIKLILFIIFFIACFQLSACKKDANCNISDINLRGITYFGDEWPVNFWSQEFIDVDKDMERIKNDGFNHIILVIPWNEVQPNIAPIKYNEYFFDQAKIVMSAAKRANLYVEIRVGYTWDFYNDNNYNLLNRFKDVMNDNSTEKAWYLYLNKLYDFFSNYDNFIGGFICWEDFWSVIGQAKAVSDLNKEVSIKFAKECGYQKYIANKYSLSEYSTLTKKNYVDYDEIDIPNYKSEAFKLFYDYFDFFLINLLKKSQKYFDDLSLETRLDADIVFTESGYSYYDHNQTYDCGDSSYCCTMYGIPMGMENVGDKVSANKALAMTENILSKYNKETDGKPLYIDQFLFFDNTPAYSNNTQIKDNEINKYLENVGYVLNQNTIGYSIWTYQDYMSNMLYNPQFGLNLNGWDINGNVTCKQIEGSNKAILSSNSSIAQSINSARNHFKINKTATVSFEITPLNDKPTTIQIVCGDYLYEFTTSLKEICSFSFDYGDNLDFKIICKEGDIAIDNVKYYTQIQDSRLYDFNWNEKQNISGIRSLNDLLKKLSTDTNDNSFINNGFFSNNTKTNENPFGNTGAKILYTPEMDDFSDYMPCKDSLFLTPEVTFESYINVQSKQSFQFGYEFYSAAKSWGSDGLLLEIELVGTNINDKIVIEVSPNEKIKFYTIDLSDYIGNDLWIRITCKCGINNDDLGDWLVIYNPIII